MQDEMDVGDFSEFDVFQADIDDITLSQVCEQMEKKTPFLKDLLNWLCHK